MSKTPSLMSNIESSGPTEGGNVPLEKSLVAFAQMKVCEAAKNVSGDEGGF